MIFKFGSNNINFQVLPLTDSTPARFQDSQNFLVLLSFDKKRQIDEMLFDRKLTKIVTETAWTGYEENSGEVFAYFARTPVTQPKSSRLKIKC